MLNRATIQFSGRACTQATMDLKFSLAIEEGSFNLFMIVIKIALVHKSIIPPISWCTRIQAVSRTKPHISSHFFLKQKKSPHF